VGAVEEGVEGKMKNQINCPLCKEELYSGLGKGCEMCGMPVDKEKKFCSERCLIKYKSINKFNKGGEK